MANDFIGIHVEGDIPKIQNFLRRYPKEAQNAIVDDVNTYLLKVVKEYPSPRSVTRTAAYGAPFFTEKQRRWFFAALARGEISVPYHRTQGLRESWQIIGKGKGSILVNESQGAPYTMGDNTQSRHEKLVGWKTIGTILKERMAKIETVAVGAAKKVLKKLKVI
jgi:hypothetical protein